MRASYAQGIPLSEEAANPPDLPPGGHWYYVAYTQLSSSRTGPAGGPGSVPYSEVLAFAGANGLDQVEFEELLAVVAVLDEAYSGHWHEVNSKS